MKEPQLLSIVSAAADSKPKLLKPTANHYRGNRRNQERDEDNNNNEEKEKGDEEEEDDYNYSRLSPEYEERAARKIRTIFEIAKDQGIHSFRLSMDTAPSNIDVDICI